VSSRPVPTHAVRGSRLATKRARTIALALALVVSGVLSACEPAPPAPGPVANAYAEAWTEGDHAAMWALLTASSQERVGEAGFLQRLPLIAAEMSLVSLEATAGASEFVREASGSPDPRRATVPLSVTFKTKNVGEFSRKTELHLVMEGEKEGARWRIDWGPEAILPELSPGRLVRMTHLLTTRGRIIARDGTELATFAEATEVGVVPGQIQTEEGLFASLGPIVGLTGEQMQAKLQQSWVRDDTYVPFATIRDVTDDVRAKLNVIEGVQLRPQRVRAYPSGILAQEIGAVGEATEEEAAARADRGVRSGDIVGKHGLEATLDAHLGGSSGWRLAIVDENERPVEVLGQVAAFPGQDAVLSIDTAMQRVAEEKLATTKGAVVVEDAWTGEILVLATGPRAESFDRAMFGQYATGSTFKLVTAAAALSSGALKPGEMVDCPQRWTGFGPQWAQVNHESSALGMIDLRTALARSCNTFFYELGKRLNDRDPNLLPNAAKSFGLGKATAIDFVFEAEGIVPSPDWKKQSFADAASQVWNPGDATNLAIGQGYLVATPIQMANYVSTVTNDGILLKPRLVVELRDRSGAVTKTFDREELGRAGVKAADLSAIRDGMRAVVADRDGTVYFPFLGYEIPVAGKSGTAETSQPGRVNAWFVGFAPFDVPRLAVATVLEGFEEKPGVHGSQDAARITRAVLAAKLGGTPQR